MVELPPDEGFSSSSAYFVHSTKPATMVRVAVVDGDSMTNTLQHGEKLGLGTLEYELIEI